MKIEIYTLKLQPAEISKRAEWINAKDFLHTIAKRTKVQTRKLNVEPKGVSYRIN